jgi:hypothetical protein
MRNLISISEMTLAQFDIQFGFAISHFSEATF